jgi:hypothetical protein
MTHHQGIEVRFDQRDAPAGGGDPQHFAQRLPHIGHVQEHP